MERSRLPFKVTTSYQDRVNDSQVIYLPVSISTTAKLNSRILWGFFNREGFLRSTIQNDKLKVKEATAITQNDTWRAWSRLLEGGGLGLTVDGGREVLLLSMPRWLKSCWSLGGWIEGSVFSICNGYEVQNLVFLKKLSLFMKKF